MQRNFSARTELLAALDFAQAERGRPHRLLVRSAALFVALLIFSTSAYPALVGSVAGELSVDPSGTANYRVPIAVPPGVAGMQPDLAFLYSSRAGNGLLGVG